MNGWIKKSYSTVKSEEVMVQINSAMLIILLLLCVIHVSMHILLQKRTAISLLQAFKVPVSY